MDETTLPIPPEYGPFLEDLKLRIRSAQVRAAVAVNGELVLLYWNIGRSILAAQRLQGWGARVIDSLSSDLAKAFPEMKGFSPRNLKYMRAFAEAWPDESVVQAPLAQLTWYHNLALLEKLRNRELRLWYANATLQNGWSRDVLTLQIKSRLHERQGAALHNFTSTLPAPQSDLAANLLKDPYNFDFLTIGKDALEREIEKALVVQSRNFLSGLRVLDLAMQFR